VPAGGIHRQHRRLGIDDGDVLHALSNRAPVSVAVQVRSMMCWHAVPPGSGTSLWLTVGVVPQMLVTMGVPRTGLTAGSSESPHSANASGGQTIWAQLVEPG